MILWIYSLESTLVLPFSNRAYWATTLDFLYLDFLFCCMLSHFSRVQHSVTLWTVVCQSPLSMGFYRQEYCCGLSFPSPRDLPDPGIKPGSPALQVDS